VHADDRVPIEPGLRTLSGWLKDATGDVSDSRSLEDHAVESFLEPAQDLHRQGRAAETHSRRDETSACAPSRWCSIARTWSHTSKIVTLSRR